jgi:FdhD protein
MIRATAETSIQKVRGCAIQCATDLLAVEEPLEIQLTHGPRENRRLESIAVTMRTPGDDLALAVGFLVTEGVIRDPGDIEQYGCYVDDRPPGREANQSDEARVLPPETSRNLVRIELVPDVTVSPAHIKRNFYTTSSCGICGKASLLAMESVCPPRAVNRFSISAATLCSLPVRLREAQAVFNATGGLHGVGLFNAEGELIAMHEDVGRHNAVDKLVGTQFLEDRVPLRDTALLLSGRASFELLQKALMAGISMVAAVGAPSSLAVQVAKRFDIALVGFLREDHFNAYHGIEHITGCTLSRLPSTGQRTTAAELRASQSGYRVSKLRGDS